VGSVVWEEECFFGIELSDVLYPDDLGQLLTPSMTWKHSTLDAGS